MATERLPMRKIREILRQTWVLGQRHRAIARALGGGVGTVSDVTRGAGAAGLDWARVQRVSDVELEQAVYGQEQQSQRAPVPTPALIVPDQLKSAVSLACRSEPEIQRTFQEWAAHYDTVVVPARPRKPRDKVRVEVGVQIVPRWILARIRKQPFFSIHELGARIAELLAELNAPVMRGTARVAASYSRRSTAWLSSRCPHAATRCRSGPR